MQHTDSEVSTNTLAIDIQNLTKVYNNGVQAIKNISLQVPQGSFFALLGANGAGKTTTIGILTDLVKKTSGKVEVFGLDIDKHFSEAKFNIGVVPQEFNFGIFEKVINIVVTQAGYYGIPLHKAKQRAVEILKILGLGDKLDSRAQELSGGMKRRLMIARALIHKPKLLILDEPTAGVDAQLRISMWDFLRDINQKQKVTILLTTHYLEEVEQLCESAAIIKDGEIVRLDTVKNLVTSLEKDIYVIDISSIPTSCEELKTNLKNSPFAIELIDDTTIEAVVDKKEKSFGRLLQYLESQNVQIHSIRTKGNRLENLFLDTIQLDKQQEQQNTLGKTYE